MDKADKKHALAMINEGMILAQALMGHTKEKMELEMVTTDSGRAERLERLNVDLKLAESMFNLFYTMELLYRDRKIDPPLKW